MSEEAKTTEESEKLKNNSVSEQPVDNSAIPVDKSKGKQRPKKVVKKSTPKKPKKNGGRRPGAGRPKGKMNARSIEKMAVKKEFEDRVAKQAHQLFNAQVTLALGEQYLFVRYQVKTAKGMRWSKFERVTDPEVMIQYLDGDFKDSKDQYFMITAAKPDAHAIDSLLDRAFGKAPQNLNIKDDRPDPIATILKKFGLLEEEGDSNNARQTEGSENTPS